MADTSTYSGAMKTAYVGEAKKRMRRRKKPAAPPWVTRVPDNSDRGGYDTGSGVKKLGSRRRRPSQIKGTENKIRGITGR